MSATPRGRLHRVRLGDRCDHVERPSSLTNGAKATTPITPEGTIPTPLGNASFVVAKNYYLHLIHPWTTGFAKAYNYLETPFRITPQSQGYDVQLGGADITVTHVYTAANFDPVLKAVTYKDYTYKQYLKGIERVVNPGSQHGPDHHELPGRPGMDAEGFLPARAHGGSDVRRRDRGPAGPVPHPEALIRAMIRSRAAGSPGGVA